MRFFSHDGNNNFIIQSENLTMEISKKEALELYQLMFQKITSLAGESSVFEDYKYDCEDYWPDSSEDDGM